MLKYFSLLLVSFLALPAFSQTPLYAIGAVTDSSARIVAFADTILGVHYWKALTLSDHEGDKEIDDAHFVSREGCCMHLYQISNLQPNTVYECVVIYRGGAYTRDTFTTSIKTPQGKLKWTQQKQVTISNESYSTKLIGQLMTAKAKRHDE